MLLLYLSRYGEVESLAECFDGLDGRIRASKVTSVRVTFVNLRMSLRALREKKLVSFERGARNRIMNIHLTHEGKREADRQRKVINSISGVD